MKKIIIRIQNNELLFLCDSTNDNTNINQIDVLNDFQYKFTESYLLSNLNLVYELIHSLVLKNNIFKAIIIDLDIACSVLNLINLIEEIKSIVFSKDEILEYSICFKLLENLNIENIECYNLPEVMYYRFRENTVVTRCELLFISNFMEINDISTYSDMCNKRKIIIPSNLTLDDINDFNYFLETNKIINILEIFDYKLDDLKIILDLIKKHDLNNISVYIYENKINTKVVLNDLKLFSDFIKDYNVDIKIKYSKEYRQKNRLKQLNITLLKWIIFGIILISIIMFIFSYYHEKNDLKNQENNKEIIDNIIDKPVDEVQLIDIEDVDDNDVYKNPYQLTYENQMIKLLELNSDTVGWLNVKNTNVDYPVVQTTDNDYYLNYSFDKTRNQLGWIFADYRNKLDKTDKNIIIYGHRVRNTNLMFTTLKNVLEESWYQNTDNLDITFNMKENLITWRIFSIYTIEKTNDYIKTDFKDDNEFLEFIDMIKNRSIVSFKQELDKDDQILTLSTCYLDSNHRLVIHAKRNN